jgi:hypothetical protein
MSVANTRRSCRDLFGKLDVLPVPCQYALSLMLFVIDNQRNFQTGLNVHILNTRNKNRLYLPTVNLSIFQKGITCTGI